MPSADQYVQPNPPDTVGQPGGWGIPPQRNRIPPLGISVDYPAIGSLGSSPDEQEVTRIRRFQAFDVPFTKPVLERVNYSALPLPRRSRQWVRFTLRHQYHTDVQRFPIGWREHGGRDPAKASTYPTQMLPPRRSRLSMRPVPGSWGQTTQVLNG